MTIAWIPICRSAKNILLQLYFIAVQGAAIPIRKKSTRLQGVIRTFNSCCITWDFSGLTTTQYEWPHKRENEKTHRSFLRRRRRRPVVFLLRSGSLEAMPFSSEPTPHIMAATTIQNTNKCWRPSDPNSPETISLQSQAATQFEYSGSNNSGIQSLKEALSVG